MVDSQFPRAHARKLATPLALLGLVAAAFLLRLFATRGTFLAPDEAIIAVIAAAPDFAGVLKLSTEQAHPPLYFLLLHAWARLFGSDAGLRFPSILLGSCVPVLLFAFVRPRLGPAAAFAASALLALSPSVVDLTSEARPYSLLLLFTTGALALVPPGAATLTPGRVAAVGGLLVAAQLTHFSGVLFAAALLPALLLQLRRQGAPARAWVAFGAVAASSALSAGLLWVAHVRQLRGSAMEARAMLGWLSHYYWQDGPFAVFLSRSTQGVFEFLLGFPAAATALTLVAFLALALRARKDAQTAVLLLAPFLVAFAASALRAYPLGATRHSAWLLPAAATALVLPLSGLGRSALSWVVPCLAVAAPVWAATAPRSSLSTIPYADRKSELMSGLTGTLERQVGPGDVVLVDRQTAALLHRYLPASSAAPVSAGAFRRERPGGLDVRVSRDWLHEIDGFEADLERLGKEPDLTPDRRVWVVNAGAEARLLAQLLDAGRGGSITSATRFGGRISVFRVEVP